MEFEGFPIEKAIRQIGKGLCMKSFPISQLTEHLIEIVELCQGGMSGSELIRLPYNQFSVFDNPNLFFQARNIINGEKARFLKEKEAKTKDK